MKEPELPLAGRAAELARAFDAGFARAPPDGARSFEGVLAIRLGRDPYALRLSQVASLFARRAIVRLPSLLPELLGLVSLRAAMVPVYDLAMLLGRARQTEPRWIVLAAQVPVALAFDELEGYRHVLPENLVAAPAEATPGAPLLEFVRTGEELRPMVQLPSVLEIIVTRAERAKKAKGG